MISRIFAFVFLGFVAQATFAQEICVHRVLINGRLTCVETRPAPQTYNGPNTRQLVEQGIVIGVTGAIMNNLLRPTTQPVYTNQQPAYNQQMNGGVQGVYNPGQMQGQPSGFIMCNWSGGQRRASSYAACDLTLRGTATNCQLPSKEIIFTSSREECDSIYRQQQGQVNVGANQAVYNPSQQQGGNSAVPDGYHQVNDRNLDGCKPHGCGYPNGAWVTRNQ